MMTTKILNNPHNLLGKFAQLSSQKQYAILLFLAFLPVCLCLVEYLQAQQQNLQMNEQISQIEQELIHQKHILTSLQQNAQTSIPPKLTSQIAQLSQSLQPQYFQLQVKRSQWTFYQVPYLTMQLIGKFSNLRQFLTALLEREPNLTLLQLHIYKDATSSPSQLIAELRFKLSLNKDE